MMNWSRKNNRYRIRPLVVMTLVVVAVLLVDVVSGGFVRAQIRSGASLAWSGAAGAYELARVWNVFETRKELIAENRALREENETLEALRLENDVVRAENAVLRDLLEVPEYGQEIATARVLSRPHASPFGTFVIGAGTDDGVSVGDYVLAPGNIALGRVAEVSDSTAVVALLLANGNTTEVLIGEDALVSLEGRGGSTGHAEVSRELSIEKGEPVLLPDIGFALGVVGEIETTPADALQSVFVGLPVNIQALRFVRVVSS